MESTLFGAGIYFRAESTTLGVETSLGAETSFVANTVVVTDKISSICLESSDD